MLTLIGSKTSPFVRKVRLYLENVELEYNFEVLDVYSPEGHARLKPLSPVRKIPVLIDGDIHVSDSRQILNYLQKKHHKKTLEWQQEELLTDIDSANDDLVLMLMLQRSGFDIQSDTLLFSNIRRRTEEIYTYLNKCCENNEFKNWDLVSMALYALLDWANFRKLASLDKYPGLQSFLKQHQDRPEVNVTAIPKDA